MPEELWAWLEAVVGWIPGQLGRSLRILVYWPLLPASLNIGEYVHIKRPSRLRAGRRIGIGRGAVLHCSGGLEIGDDTFLGPNVSIFTDNHVFADTDRPIHSPGNTLAPVMIGRDCWIGANAALLAGVRVGDGAVIAAGAVLNQDVPRTPCGVECLQGRSGSGRAVLALAAAMADLVSIAIPNYNFDDPRLRLVRDLSNIGFARNRNRVVGETRGAHAPLLSSDEVMRPGAIEALRAGLARSPGPNHTVVRATLETIDDNDETLHLNRWKDKIGARLVFEEVEFRVAARAPMALVEAVVQQDIIARRDALQASGPAQDVRRHVRFGQTRFPAQVRKDWRWRLLVVASASGPMGSSLPRAAVRALSLRRSRG